MGYLTYLLAILLVVLYLARLIILSATNPVIAVTGALSDSSSIHFGMCGWAWHY